MKNRARWRWLAYPCLGIVLGSISIAVLAQAAKPREFIEVPRALNHLEPPALFKKYCSACHASGRTRIEFDEEPTRASVHQEPALWQKIAQAVRAEQMPPLDEAVPPVNPIARERMIAWIEDSLRTVDSARIAARRLGVFEYGNAVRDLLGVDVRPSHAPEAAARETEAVPQVILPADFPADEPYWTLYPDDPVLPADVLPPYHAAAAAIVKQLERDPRLNRMSHAERRRAIESLARRAFRRPLTQEETARWQRCLDDATCTESGSSQGFQAALHDVLTSPQFLYRTERRPEGAPPESRSQFEFASRLASFLWSSVPDEELLADAEQGTLTARLDQHVARMLADRRAERLGPRFANHWLRLQELDAKDELPAPVRGAMRLETERLVCFILQENRDILDLLNAAYSFIDETMAKHYGIEGIEGNSPRLVFHRSSERRGLLGHASILTLTSPGPETSPMRRGRWILENLLGQRVPPPPLGVNLANDSPAPLPGAAATDSVQRLLRGRGQISCGAYCHAPIAGLGAALENYGSFGAWRTEYALSANTASSVNTALSVIDATGVAPTGEVIAGPRGLSSYLMGQKEAFLRCLSDKLLTCGLERKSRDSDQAALDEIVEQLRQGDWRFARVVQQVVASGPFQRGFVERWPSPPPAAR